MPARPTPPSPLDPVASGRRSSCRRSPRGSRRPPSSSGCAASLDLGQGYLFSRPVPAAAIEELLRLDAARPRLRASRRGVQQESKPTASASRSTARRHSGTAARSATSASPTRRASQAEEALGDLEGGRRSLFASGMAAATAVVLALLEPGKRSRSARAATTGRPALRGLARALGARGVPYDQTGPPPDDVRMSGSRRRRTRCSDLPGPRRAAARAPGRSSSSTRPPPRRCCCARSSTAPTSSSTARRSTSAATPTCCSARPSARDAATRDRLHGSARDGRVAAPDSAWLLLRGLKTLRLRVRRQSETALELARRLAAPRRSTASLPGPRPDPLAARYMTRVRRRCCRSTSPAAARRRSESSSRRSRSPTRRASAASSP